MSKAFDNWWEDNKKYFDPSLEDECEEVFEAGRAYQREVDAWIADELDQSVSALIWEQKIDD